MLCHTPLPEDVAAFPASIDPPGQSADVPHGRPALLRFLRRLETLLADGDGRPPFAVLMLEVGRFRTVRDALGQGAASRMLAAIHRRLRSCIPRRAAVIRCGRAELAILLEDLEDAAESERRAERIHQRLTAPLNHDGRQIFTGVAIGIAPGGDGYQEPQDLLRDAAAALDRARRAGVPYRLFDPRLRALAVERFELENDLYRAVDRGEMRLRYQPIVSLRSGEIVALEALVRWRHPRHGELLPQDFLELAVETGLIRTIDRWVLTEACRQLAAWRADGLPRLKICVNLAGEKLQKPSLPLLIGEILSSAGLDPGDLNVEINEGAQLDPSAIATVSELGSLGIGLQIDDFGTGYSSLSYLHRLPSEGLKIDRSFVAGMLDDPAQAEIVDSLVRLAHNLGLTVVAEGVETIAQLRRLEELGCDYAQGFFLSRPLDGDLVPALLAGRFIKDLDEGG